MLDVKNKMDFSKSLITKFGSYVFKKQTNLNYLVNSLKLFKRIITLIGLLCLKKIEKATNCARTLIFLPKL
jgi:hypothetical protein